jgi:hypothetical protein
MTRSPLAYPLNRSADMDVGGAADLQTDIMRFMAILSLCLVAIFALVQSIPLTPAEPVPPDSTPAPTPVLQTVTQTEPTPAPVPVTKPRSEPEPVEKTEQKAVSLTRPKWQPKYTASTPVPTEPVTTPEVARVETTPAPEPPVEALPPPMAEKKSFTLRFASDAALTRAVAAHHVGLYALGKQQVKRMTVSESRISFWDASTPNTFHEMETSTVPNAVIDALARTGVATDDIGWGVTLPGKVKTQMNSLMQSHESGSLIIDAAGDVHWEEQ